MSFLDKLKCFSLRGFLYSLVVRTKRFFFFLVRETNRRLNSRYSTNTLSCGLKEKMMVDILADKITEISIIITTRNRLETLKDYTLPSLKHLKFDQCSYEIIIVDNNSTDETLSFLQHYAKTEPLVKIYREKRVGVSAGRNKGVQMSIGELIVFIDDDCEVDADWLDRLYHLHSEKGYFLGQGQIYDLVLKKNLVDDKPLRETVAGGNLSIRRKVFDYISFNEQIIFSHDDTDLIRQLETLWPNFPYFVDPTPIKHHRAPATYRQIDGNYNQESIRQSKKMYNLARISELTLGRNLNLIWSGLAWRFWRLEIIFSLLESILYPQANILVILKTKLKIYRQLIYLNKFSQNRYASFTFDDGLITSARKIDKIISPHKATFYIVTGWLKPNPLSIIDPPNIKPDHGDIAGWQELTNRGYEIGSHTVSHIRASEPGAEKEYQASIEFIKQFQPGPYSLAMPNSTESPSTINSYDSIRVGDGEKIYNSLKEINFARLISWDPVENKLSLEQTLKKIKYLPADSWLILRAHGLDDDGYCPWPSEYLKEIYKLLRDEGFQIRTIKEMVNDFGPLADKR